MTSFLVRTLLKFLPHCALSSTAFVIVIPILYCRVVAMAISKGQNCYAINIYLSLDLRFYRWLAKITNACVFCRRLMRKWDILSLKHQNYSLFHLKRFKKSHQKVVVRNSDILMRISHFLMRPWEKQVIGLIIYMQYIILRILQCPLLLSTRCVCRYFSIFFSCFFSIFLLHGISKETSFYLHIAVVWKNHIYIISFSTLRLGLLR